MSVTNRLRSILTEYHGQIRIYNRCHLYESILVYFTDSSSFKNCWRNDKRPWIILFCAQAISNQIRFSVTVGDIVVWYINRNQIIISKICAIISKAHETLLWVTGLWGIFICLMPSALLNSVLCYVIMVFFYSKRYTEWKNTKRLIRFTDKQTQLKWKSWDSICALFLRMSDRRNSNYKDQVKNDNRNLIHVWSHKGLDLAMFLYLHKRWLKVVFNTPMSEQNGWYSTHDTCN